MKKIFLSMFLLVLLLFTSFTYAELDSKKKDNFVFLTESEISQINYDKIVNISMAEELGIENLGAVSQTPILYSEKTKKFYGIARNGSGQLLIHPIKKGDVDYINIISEEELEEAIVEFPGSTVYKIDKEFYEQSPEIAASSMMTLRNIQLDYIQKTTYGLSYEISEDLNFTGNVIFTVVNDIVDSIIFDGTMEKTMSKSIFEKELAYSVSIDVAIEDMEADTTVANINAKVIKELKNEKSWILKTNPDLSPGTLADITIDYRLSANVGLEMGANYDELLEPFSLPIKLDIVTGTFNFSDDESVTPYIIFEPAVGFEGEGKVNGKVEYTYSGNHEIESVYLTEYFNSDKFKDAWASGFKSVVSNDDYSLYVNTNYQIDRNLMASKVSAELDLKLGVSASLKAGALKHTFGEANIFVGNQYNANLNGGFVLNFLEAPIGSKTSIANLFTQVDSIYPKGVVSFTRQMMLILGYKIDFYSIVKEYEYFFDLSEKEVETFISTSFDNNLIEFFVDKSKNNRMVVRNDNNSITASLYMTDFNFANLEFNDTLSKTLQGEYTDYFTKDTLLDQLNGNGTVIEENVQDSNFKLLRVSDYSYNNQNYEMTFSYDIFSDRVYEVTIEQKSFPINIKDSKLKERVLKSTYEEKYQDPSGEWKFRDVSIDTNSDGEITSEEALMLLHLNVSNYGIEDISGLEYFKNLEYLDLRYNNISDFSVLDGNTIDKLYTEPQSTNEIKTYVKEGNLYVELSKGDSFKFINDTSTNYNIKKSGSGYYDLLTLRNFKSSVSASKGIFNSTVNVYSGDEIIISNVNEETLTFYAPLETFNPVISEEPAIRYIKVEPGQTLKSKFQNDQYPNLKDLTYFFARNSESKVDSKRIDEEGVIGTWGQNVSGFSISLASSWVHTNKGNEPVVFYYPNIEGVITSFVDEEAFVYLTLFQDETYKFTNIQSQNTGAYSIKQLNNEDKYDYASYDGTVYSFTVAPQSEKSLYLGSLELGNKEKVVITNKYQSESVLFGPSEFFETAEKVDYQALTYITLNRGESFKAFFDTDEYTLLYSKDSNQKIDSVYIKKDGSSDGMWHANSTVNIRTRKQFGSITGDFIEGVIASNPYNDTITIYGVSDVFHPFKVNEEAIKHITLARGQGIEFLSGSSEISSSGYYHIMQYNHDGTIYLDIKKSGISPIYANLLRTVIMNENDDLLTIYIPCYSSLNYVIH